MKSLRLPMGPRRIRPAGCPGEPSRGWPPTFPAGKRGCAIWGAGWCLAGIVKGGDGRLEPLQVVKQQAFGRRGLASGFPIGKKRIPVPLESRVWLAAGEVQVAEDFLQDSRIGLRRFALRSRPLYFHVVSKPSCTRFGKMNAGGRRLRRPARLQSVERSTTLT